ncbi:MAG: class 1 fructose-bisphosphatase [Deltaproteobacteria bacterium]|nr:class 1 fructose-bisphosphatase [Deltaproteobacteria bacterium]
MAQRGTTIERHIFERQRATSSATGELSGLLQQIATASKIINSKVNQAGLADALGVTGEVNVQGEEVQKLDEFANSILIRCVEAGGHLCCMASEEVEELITIPDRFTTGKYVLMFDPLDGSTNIDVNISIGTIFSVHKRMTTGRNGTVADCLQRGTEQVAAGYVIYGSSTMFVYSTGEGVHGFTLDPSVGEYFLSHPNIQTPKHGKTYSVNDANCSKWVDPLQAYVNRLRSPQADGSLRSARYVGTLVADFHRTLLKGGIFMYPGEKKKPEGKLRLLYEASPMAFLAERAGGAASDGKRRILEIVPDKLHQRTPLFIGSAEDVADAVRSLG